MSDAASLKEEVLLSMQCFLLFFVWPHRQHADCVAQGNALFKNGQFKEAAVVYSKAIRLNPPDIQVYYSNRSAGTSLSLDTFFFQPHQMQPMLVVHSVFRDEALHEGVR